MRFPNQITNQITWSRTLLYNFILLTNWRNKNYLRFLIPDKNFFCINDAKKKKKITLLHLWSKPQIMSIKAFDPYWYKNKWIQKSLLIHPWIYDAQKIFPIFNFHIDEQLWSYVKLNYPRPELNKSHASTNFYSKYFSQI